MAARASFPRALTVCAACAAGGALVSAAGVAIAPRAMAIAYLVAYSAVLALVLGALLLLMSAHLSGAVWFLPFRRNAERVAAGLPALAVLTVPLLMVPQLLWAWAGDAAAQVPPRAPARLEYLRQGVWTARAVLYWIVWLGVGEMVRRRSQPNAAAGAGAARARRASLDAVSAAGIALVALAMTFAAFDWMMSLSPGWSSTVYGAYYFAGGMVGALAAVAVLGHRAQRRGGRAAPTTDHVQALGRLTLAFVLLWGYLWYAQFFIIWIGDIPREVPWYLARLDGGWRALAAVVVIGGFALPLIVLLFRLARGSGSVLAGLGAWLMVLHYLDIYWVIVPSVRPGWSAAYLLWDAAALALVIGSTAGVALWRERAAPRVPADDPMLQRSLQYEVH